MLSFAKTGPARQSDPSPHGATEPGDIDRINRAAWRTPQALRQYRSLKGWTDPGEQAAFEHLAPSLKDQPILDVGVGAGRTTDLLLPISRDYTAIDYTAEMVDAMRERFPDVRVEHRDARDLSAFADGQFAGVVFSYNGIDSVDRADHERVLHEFHRVLRPGGVLVMSAFNRVGPVYGERPRLDIPFSWNPLRLAARTLRALGGLPKSVRNHARLQKLNEVHDDWAMMNCGAHRFGIVVMYTTLAEQKRLLERAGFQTELVLDSVHGQSVTDEMDTSAIPWFHYVARKT